MQVHIGRLEKMFDRLGIGPKGGVSRVMEALVAEAKDLSGDAAEPTVLDAALIVACQRMTFVLMASMACERTLARRLGHETAVTLLQEMMDEDGATVRQLTELAGAIVHVAAPV